MLVLRYLCQPMIPWHETYSVGSAEIDAQHRHILGLVNAVEEAACSGGGAGTIEFVLDHLFRFLDAHFVAEERLMLAVGFPGLTVHKQEHDACRERLLDLTRQYRTQQVELAPILAFVTDWLQTHLLGSDQAYVTYVATQRSAEQVWAANNQLERSAT